MALKTVDTKWSTGVVKLNGVHNGADTLNLAVEGEEAAVCHLCGVRRLRKEG